MSRPTRYISLALVCVASCGLRPSPAANADEPGDFHPLFNGKDFSGWVTPEDKSLFTVEDGQIVGRTKGRPQEERVPGDREALRRFRAQGQGEDSKRQLGHPVPQQAQGRRCGLGATGRRRRRILGAALRGTRPWHSRAIPGREGQRAGEDGRLERVCDHGQGAARHDRLERHADHRPRRSRNSTRTGSSPFKCTSARPMEVRYKDIEIKEIKP